ncbi:MAG: aminotransferase class V-fold PLP-dependent enzyme [Aigarchaeota archaeon]|nr:aminotransferase class V-fold PLP-dependent enzyme [Aigarchaeota archaeon]MDW8093145.1 aminotransferase class V-fold PLP-dependent enzyme [Nitrososphaerota archaeon]
MTREDDFPILSRYTYLDSASHGATPRRVVEAEREYIESKFTDGEDWPRVLSELFRSKALFSSLVKVKRSNVAVVPNVSTGLGLLLSSLNLKRGSTAVASLHNFPTSLHILTNMRRRGTISDLRVARNNTIDEYERLIDDSTSVVCVDAVGWLSGRVVDLRALSEIAHDHGAIMISDMFHACGVIPVDIKNLGLDAAISGMYKWLLGQPGVSFLVATDEILEVSDPPLMGWFSIDDSVTQRFEKNENPFFRPLPLLDAKPARDASRFELGTLSDSSVIAAAAALELMNEIDEHARHSSIERLVKEMADLLSSEGHTIYTPLDSHKRSGIVSIKIKEAFEVSSRLRSRRIICSARFDLLRTSLHFYNTRDDIDVFIKALREVLRG